MPDGSVFLPGLDLEAIAAELVRRSPDGQMRLALLSDEFDEWGRGVIEGKSASPLTQQGAATPGNPKGRPAGNVAKPQGDQGQAPPFHPPHLSNPTPRMLDLCAGLPRYIAIVGFVS